MSRFLSVLYTYTVGIASGLLLYVLHIPLPWILGPITGVMLFKLFITPRTTSILFVRNIGFCLLGIQIGLTFTAQTFARIGPYFIPYTIFSLILIAMSLCIAYIIAKRTSVDMGTSMIGSAPGGLSAMMALSESMDGNTILVTIFHTIRLLSVLFVVPFIATHWLYTSQGMESAGLEETMTNGPVWTVFIYILTFIVGYQLQHRIPASLVAFPMFVVGLFQAFEMELFQLPNLLFIVAQVTIGVHLGNSISLRDVVKAGRYCLYYLGLALLLIFCSIAFGYLLSAWTHMDVITAVLSLAPGGLIEMGITANSTGGSAAIVSSLQMIRLLTIILILPPLFKWLIPKLK